MTAARVSRNDPCPCGSGLKYKKCHEGKDAEKPTRSGLLTMVVLGLLIVGGATAVVITFARDGGSALKTGGRPGQVWSPEHGHWHDASAPASAPLNPGAIGQQKSPPAGTPPPGKVWSAEHGHWHDAAQPIPGLAGTPATLPATGEQNPPPPGPPPPGKVWSTEHGHWHDAPQPIPGLAATAAPAPPPPPQPNP